MTQTVVAAAAADPSIQSPSLGRAMLAGLSRSRTGLIGAIVFFTICIGAMVLPHVITPDKVANPDKVYQWPSTAHWLGTDGDGKDILKQILAGGQDVIIVGVVSALISTAIAIAGGALAAYQGGWLDSMVVQVTDFFLTIPAFPLLVVLSAYLSIGHAIYLAVLLGCLGWAGLLRAVRAQVLSLKEREYIEAARLLGLGSGRIIIRDIVPNMASYIMINFILSMTGAVYSLVGLYLLGLAPMSGTNWGIMVNQAWIKGALFYKGSLFYMLSPLIIIALLQLSAIWFTRSLEEILNPRLRSDG